MSGSVVAPNPARAADTLKITEIFLSLQGEGTRVGLPCTLVRLTGCDLRCRWCDTEYAFTGGARRSFDEILAEVARLGCPLVEITGGEPLLQPNVHGLIARLLDRGYDVLLETGGHRDVAEVDPRVVKILDLKAPGSGEVDANRVANLDHLTPRDEVKVVIADRVDYEWARDRVREHRLDERVAVLFSAVHGELAPATLARWILDDGLGVRLQVQLHKLLWGAETRGV
jgi:7-carboxy-7-deazaguanine synthase